MMQRRISATFIFFVFGFCTQGMSYAVSLQNSWSIEKLVAEKECLKEYSERASLQKKFNQNEYIQTCLNNKKENYDKWQIEAKNYCSQKQIKASELDFCMREMGPIIEAKVRITRYQSRKTYRKARIAEFRASITKAEAGITEAESRITETDARTTETGAKIADFRASIAKAEAKIANYEARITKYESKIDGLKSKISKGEARIAENESSIVKPEVRTVKADAPKVTIKVPTTSPEKETASAYTFIKSGNTIKGINNVKVGKANYKVMFHNPDTINEIPILGRINTYEARLKNHALKKIIVEQSRKFGSAGKAEYNMLTDEIPGCKSYSFESCYIFSATYIFIEPSDLGDIARRDWKTNTEHQREGFVAFMTKTLIVEISDREQYAPPMTLGKNYRKKYRNATFAEWYLCGTQCE